MFNKLIRYYNQNRKVIWIIIIFVAFFLILLQVIFGMARNSRQNEYNELIEEYYRNQQNTDSVQNNNINSENITTTRPSVQQTEEEMINQFVNLCNEGKIKEAYGMLSTDCKTNLYPTENNFNQNYYKKIFTTKKSVKIEHSTYGGGIYQVTYYQDVLTNGGKLENSFQDNIYIVKEEQGKKLSINKFMYIETMDKTTQSNSVFVNILQKNVYIDYEEYEIQIANNSANKITVAQNKNDIHLVDQNGVDYFGNVTELPTERLIIESGKVSNFKLTFNKIYNTERTSKYLVFENIISNDKTIENNEQKTIKISINL